MCYRQLQALPRRVRRALQRRWRRSLAEVALLLALGQGPALAVTINVDGTSCTLGNAITAANTDALVGGCDGSASTGADTLVLVPGSVHSLTAVDNTLYGATGLPVVTSEITILGNGSTVRRDGATALRLLAVGSLGDLTVEQLTLRNGQTSENGGAVINAGTLTLSQCTLTGNTAANGGGVANNAGGTLTLSQSTLTGNVANYDGGGVRNVGALTLTRSTLTGNVASYDGGGVYNSGTMTISQSTLTDNSATGYGGGVSNSGMLTLGQSTLTGNTAGVSGGGVYTSGGTAILSQSLLSGNTGPDGRELYLESGTVTVNDDNLFGYDGDAGLYGVSAGATDVVPGSGVLLNAILASTLAFNGGPTQTLNLVSGSPALNQIPAANCTTTDQRGFLRPGSGSTDCDIGALEFQAVAPAQVNSSVTFVAQKTTYKTTTPAPSQCPVGSVGAFSFQALLTVKAGSSTLEALKAQIRTLTQGNTLMVADVGTVDAPVRYTFAAVGQFSDEELAAGESLVVPFVVCLKTFNTFQFFVNVLGHSLP
jgi:hypothetical protein